ncbi:MULTISPECIES: hypothetical protein [unclassified Microbacterium]|uniref:hypothetical protein n=1 Tax=unclassified Microbacterium TaxID=2609290 RepID=UPI00049343F3|nr:MULTISPECIES: hypothetical protein [unclassified Microbacterium]MCV0333361.1 hypothetical protein [Microbacterium sp.]MCV0375806.1 hypothetical protein [Microbacterium sp.]MCV0388839.1 hypothetical protein [Microbacterium sp.]MCV0417367.1 hypothetical protein [Microbacterium sp.]MCV0420678.1 hypothetical protein [Microbacterium sp.]
MILWFTIVQIVVAVAAGVFCLVAGLIGRRPSDFSVGALALVEALLIVQVIVAIIAPFSGNPPTGDLLEFWVYLVSAVLLPVGAVLWALMERSRWSTVILGVAALAIAIMLWRMQVIWAVQLA